MPRKSAPAFLVIGICFDPKMFVLLGASDSFSKAVSMAVTRVEDYFNRKGVKLTSAVVHNIGDGPDTLKKLLIEAGIPECYSGSAVRTIGESLMAAFSEAVSSQEFNPENN